MLHVAPEPALEGLLRPSLGDLYLTTDMHRTDVDVRADLCALPFADGIFDVVICSHVLEYVRDDELALSEMRRVLRPGGVAIVLVAIEADLRGTVLRSSAETEPGLRRHFEDPGHLRRYGPDFSALLEHAGFDVRRLTPVDLLSTEEIRRFGIPEGIEVIHHSTRR